MFVFSKLKRMQPITYLWTFLIISSKKFIKQLVVIDGDALARKVVTLHKSAIMVWRVLSYEREGQSVRSLSGRR